MAAEPGATSAVARSLVGNALRLRRGEHLVVASWNHTLPWAAAAVAEARRIGAAPSLLLEDEGAFWRSIELAPRTRRWAELPRTSHAALRRADAVLYFPGPADRPRLRRLPTDVRAPFRDEDDRWLRRIRTAGARGIRCLLGYASDAQAEVWGVPGPLWRNQLIRGIVRAEPDQVARDALRVARQLGRGRELRVTSDQGTDLRLRLRGRTPWIDDGRVDADDLRRGRAVATAPAGSVVVAVDERSASGVAIASRPSYLAEGRTEGAQWEIEGGRLRNYWYPEGGEAFDAGFAKAPAGRETVALVSLGLNPALSAGVPQAEDEEEGTVTIAIGGNTFYGGRNRCAFLSWLTIGQGSVAVDGAPLYDRGKLV